MSEFLGCVIEDRHFERGSRLHSRSGGKSHDPIYVMLGLRMKISLLANNNIIDTESMRSAIQTL